MVRAVLGITTLEWVNQVWGFLSRNVYELK